MEGGLKGEKGGGTFENRREENRREENMKETEGTSRRKSTIFSIGGKVQFSDFM